MTPLERQVDEELGAARPLLQAPEPQGAAASSELKQQVSQVRMALWICCLAHAPRCYTGVMSWCQAAGT